jgi:hypothetical protein
MTVSNCSNYRSFKSAIWEISVAGALAALWVLSGCGGYRASSGSSMPGSMPGQPPKTYHPMHRLVQPPANDSGPHSAVGN